MPHRLFCYGTLRQDDVQTALFGAPVPTVADELPGWRVDWVRITDPAVVATSGSDRHPILHPGGPGDAVAGARLDLDDAGLARVDAYEVDDYQRVEVRLSSGVLAWVYVAGPAG